MSDLIIFAGLVALGYFAGSWAEKKHYKSIQKREKEFIHLPAVTGKTFGVDDEAIQNATMVYGSAVISIDYFKRILAGLRNIFGGTVKSYESLIDRARREALLRMKAMAQDASIIVNVRIETTSIGKRANKKGGVGCIEAIAYGTAIAVQPKHEHADQ